MGEGKKVVEYVSKVQKLVHLMKGCGETLTDKMIVEKLWKKNGGSNKFKDEFDKTQGKKPWSNSHKKQVEDRTSESSKGEGGNYRKDREDKKFIGVQCYHFTDNHVESKIWLLDLGCLNHMTGQKVWLANFDESKKSKEKLVDNSSLQAEGTGNIVFHMINGRKNMIKDMFYVPCMKSNLLSVGQLVEKGLSVFMKDGV
ncbi:uncharacterized protein LOC131657891 [Vicia villosa]|uniref:uncharacterized protein LOC131657891 n=1 Tax=Vicia villosa TaxID=3911 RepID=UPI00273CD199|nr:uncharacterized protein LOC131657891 [Vicia villosa]